MSSSNGTDPEEPLPVGPREPQLSGGERPLPDGGKGSGGPARPGGRYGGGPGGHGAATGRPVGRRRSRLRDLPLIGWLAAAVVIAVAHRWLPDANWLMLHLVLLGALTHAIVVWSFHFAQTLLRSPASEVEAARHNRRLGLLTLGAAAVLIGVPTTWWPLTLVGGLLVAVAVGWHGLVLWGMLRWALPARFRVTVRYYLGAAASLLVGVTFGVLLALGWEDPWHGRLLVAHAMANVLGWVGLTLTGTLLTLWPTMLRTRMDQVAERWTQQALPVFGAAIAVAVGGALVGLSWLAALGVAFYLVALGLWGRGLWRPARTRPPREFAPASVAAALVWLVIGLAWAGWLLATAPDWTAVREGFIWPAAVLAAGFAVQVLAGALSYLLPSVLGGGPSVVRAGQRWFNRAGSFRLIAINGGLLLWLLPSPSWVKVTGSLLALGAAAAFLPLMILGLKASIAARRELALATLGGPAVRVGKPGTPGVGPVSEVGLPSAGLVGELGSSATGPEGEAGRRGTGPVDARHGLEAGGTGTSSSSLADEPAPTREGAIGGSAGSARAQRPEPERPSIFTAGQLIAGLTALATAVVVGVGVDPGAAGAAGPAPTASVAVQPTGKVVRIEVSMGDMKFTPSSVTVQAGDALVLDLVNTDTTTHDVVIGTARSARIGPGKRTELDAGVIGASVQGYCTVAGHRQMGMVFDVIVEGGAQPGAQPSASEPGHQHGPASPVPGASLASDQVVDPVLPPLTGERVHRLTLTVQEVPLQVAPGIWQRRWTYNGSPVGPTLHGRVGDVFDITLVNDGSMGHSIDFHAGSLAPDRPMRTIEPGERLTYRFTATKAGIWMYHCSTHPMSAHIAAGMAGAVVIEPEGLPAVDRSYVLVQSEAYLADRALTAEAATEVDAVGGRNPDYVMFNGVANGYDQHRLAARVGERVRFWVLDVGPNRPSSFHIVGAQFDTVFSEGSYLLKRGRDAFGDRSGGAQALGLQPAQGGFVETVFGEPGNYALVSHIMSDAERGAHGFVHVTARDSG